MKKISLFLVGLLLVLLFAVTSAAEQDYNLWKNDIENRNPTYSVSHVAVGSGFKVKVVETIGGAVVIEGAFTMTLWNAYKSLRLTLLGGENLIPLSTTVQRDALGTILDGTRMWNKDLKRLEICSDGGTAWFSAGGFGLVAPAAYGEMNMNETNGDPVDASSHNVTSFSPGILDTNSLVTFSDNSTGDRLVIGVGGAGLFDMQYNCNFTNDGGEETVSSIFRNGNELLKTMDTRAGDSSDVRGLRGSVFQILNENDYLTMNIVSEEVSDRIETYQCSIKVYRVN